MLDNMPKGEGSQFEAGVWRHAPKKPEKDLSGGQDIKEQAIDAEVAEQEAQPTVEFLLKQLDEAPEGTIMAIEPSNVKRAQQTRELVVGMLREQLAEREDIEVVELGDDMAQAEDLIERINKDPITKVLLADTRPTWLLGFEETDKALNASVKWKNRFGHQEELMGKLWAAKNDELPLLQKQIREAGFDVALDELQPYEFVLTPEEAAFRQIKWHQAMKKIGEQRFPGRALRLEGVSHNIRSDFTSLALLDEEISVESIDQVLGAKFREPFERSSFDIDENGGVHVQRGDLSKSYSPEEFNDLLEKIRERSRARKQKWELNKD